jgi:hypothetical protein
MVAHSRNLDIEDFSISIYLERMLLENLGKEKARRILEVRR